MPCPYKNTMAPVTGKPTISQRRSLRLIEYDYRQVGGYFVTVCVYRRESLFGEIRDGKMRLNHCGRIARECFEAIPEHHENTAVDEFVVMPNHVHGIIV